MFSSIIQALINWFFKLFKLRLVSALKGYVISEFSLEEVNQA